MAKNVLCAENFEKLRVVIEENKDVQGALMPILHEAQGIFGAIPLEVQKAVSEGLGIPLAEIYGVVTFYSQFRLEPVGDFLISVCLGTACYVKGAQAIADRIGRDLNVKLGGTTADGKFTLEATRCIGACGLAPVITVNEDVYGRLVESQVPDILSKY